MALLLQKTDGVILRYVDFQWHRLNQCHEGRLAVAALVNSVFINVQSNMAARARRINMGMLFSNLLQFIMKQYQKVHVGQKPSYLATPIKGQYNKVRIKGTVYGENVRAACSLEKRETYNYLLTLYSTDTHFDTSTPRPGGSAVSVSDS